MPLAALHEQKRPAKNGAFLLWSDRSPSIDCCVATTNHVARWRAIISRHLALENLPISQKSQQKRRDKRLSSGNARVWLFGDNSRHAWEIVSFCVVSLPFN
jgi:hypothetical protein